MGNKGSRSKKNDTVKDNSKLDLFSEALVQTQCDQTLCNCYAAKRLCKILIEFNKFKNHRNLCTFQSMQECIEGLSEGNPYNNTVLLNDYIHLLNEHNSHKDYEDVYKYFVSKMTNCCNVITCSFFLRHQRDRSRDYDVNIRRQLYNTSETKEINTQQIMDKIHCYWLHTYDLGYRLTLNEIEKISVNDNESKSNDDTFLVNCVDNELLYRQRIIKSKRERFAATENKQKMRPVDDRNMNAKWMLKKDEKCHRTKDEKLGEIYSFGFPYKYSKYHNKSHWYIAKKYDTFKIEITTNLTHYLSMVQFDDWFAKAEDYFESYYCKQMAKWMGLSITIQHLLAVMIYCGADELQRTLTETYRKIDEKESDEDLIKRHSEYANWGSLLLQAVNFFGIEISKCSVKTFYHGIDHEMTFESTVAFFNGPLSTSSEYQVALVFATRANSCGLIIELEKLDGSHTCYFDCAWLSQYPYECEKLFIGGDFGLIIKNIVEPMSGENYGIFIEGLNIIQQMMRGEMYKYIKKKQIPKYIKKCVVKLLNHQLYKQTKSNKYEMVKELPMYIKQSLQCYCINLVELSIDWRALHGICENKTYKGYEFAKHIFVINNFNQSFMDLNVISLLFPNVYKLSIVDVRLCRNTVKAMLSYCEKNNNNKSKLKEIIIYRPIKVFSFEHNEQDTIEKALKNKQLDYETLTQVDVIHMAIQQYSDQFSKFGWHLALKAKFELLLSKDSKQIESTHSKTTTKK